MRTPIILGLTFFLVGCGQSSTPLAHALSALRAGDYSDFLKAKDEADVAVKTALQPGGDICKVTVLDVVKYSDAARIARFNHPELFSLPEDDRLVYAFAVAGDQAQLESSSFLAGVPLAGIIMGDKEAAPNCPQRDASERESAMNANGKEKMAREEARLHVLQDWIGDAKQRYGDKLDSQMRSAVTHLEMAGFGAKWPPQTDLKGYATMPTFQQVRDSL